jgi:hypothetical protein
MDELVTASHPAVALVLPYVLGLDTFQTRLLLLQHNRNCEILILAYRPAPDKGVRTNGKSGHVSGNVMDLFYTAIYSPLPLMGATLLSCIVVYVLCTYLLHVSPVCRTLTIEQSSGATIVNSFPLARRGNSPSDLYRGKPLYVVHAFVTLFKTRATDE